LYDGNDGEPYAVVTKNIVEADIADNEMILDTNNLPDVHDILFKAGIVGPIKRTVRSGFCEYPVVDLLVNPDQ
jgi:hypothetical protein